MTIKEVLEKITSISRDIKEGVICSNSGGGSGGGGCSSSGGGYVGGSWSGGGGRSGGGIYSGDTGNAHIAVRWFRFIAVVVATKDDLEWIHSLNTTATSLIVNNLTLFDDCCLSLRSRYGWELLLYKEC